MKNFRIILTLAFTALTATACSTTPDPAVVCTSDWISARSDKAINEIEKKSSRSLKALKSAAESYANGKTPNFLQLLSLRSSLTSLEKELKSGQGIKDLRTLSKTCNDPKIISDAMGGFLRKQGFPENMVNYIEGLRQYQDLLSPDAPVSTS